MGLVKRKWTSNDVFVAVDPGKDHYAYATFYGPKFESCGINRHVNDRRGLHDEHDADYLVIEEMVVYPGVRQEDPNDLISVAFTAGRIASNFDTFYQVPARTWKGQVSKEITKGRVIEILGFDPCAAMPKKDSNHIYDAIGIGLWWQGRYK